VSGARTDNGRRAVSDPRLTLPCPPGFVEAVAERVAELLEDEQGAPELWIDVQAAAEHLACPTSRVYALVSADRIPHHRDGSRLLFRRSELDEYVERGGATRP